MNREVTVRIGSAALGIPLTLALVYQGGVVYAVIILLIAIRGAYELIAILRSKDVVLVKEVVYPAVTVAVFAPFALDGIALGLIYPTVTLVTVAGCLTYYVMVAPTAQSPDPRFQFGAILGAGASVLTTMYVSLFSFFIMLRQLSQPAPSGPWSLGACLLVMTLVGTWAVDAGAYFIGRAFGRNRLAPRVSPGKSREGALAGWLMGALTTMVTGRCIGVPMPHAIVIGLIVGCAGQAGDLAKSVIKRDVGVKDFPALIPGHGGVMDRFDSLLFNVPLVYIYAVSVLGMK